MMIKASGVVFKEDIKTKLSGAVVKATSTEGVVLSTVSDDQGEFSFDRMDPGKWSLVAMKEGYNPGQPQALELAADHKDLKFELARRMETVDEKGGKIFFYVALGGLGLLMAVYIILHFAFPQIYGSKEAQKSFLWGAEPFRFLEVLFWSLAGILTNKIILTGWYLRSHRFYKDGIVMHIAHIATTPLLVLVTVLILSLATLNITLLGNELTINLSDPWIMAAFAFIIGTSPWPLWRFIEDTAKRFTGQLG